MIPQDVRTILLALLAVLIVLFAVACFHAVSVHSHAAARLYVIVEVLLLSILSFAYRNAVLKAGVRTCSNVAPRIQRCAVQANQFIDGWIDEREKRRLEKRRRPSQQATELPEPHSTGSVLVLIEGDGSYAVETVGESHYVEAFEQICGPRSKQGEDRKVVATLIPEPTNPHDSNAIAVFVAGRKVAHLNREDAIRYRDLIIPDTRAGHAVSCAAHIRGGWDCGEDD